MKSALFFALLAAAPAFAQPARPPAPVTVAPALTQPFKDQIRALGTVRAEESVDLTARVTDKVVALHFSDGQRVEAGALLVELDKTGVEARLDGVAARLKQHQAEWQRVSQLAKRGMATASERDAQRAAMDAARAERETLRVELSDRDIKAPFSGVLGLRRVSVGALVSPGTVVATLDALDAVYLDFPVPAVHLAALRPGQPVVATASAWPEPFRGQVTVVDTRVDPVTRAVTVRARLANDDGRLRPGLLMEVNLETGVREVLSVPEGALSPQGRQQQVFTVVDGKVVARPVRVGRRRAGRVEILEGLEAGVSVVVDGVHRVRPGAAVAVQPAGAASEPTP